MKNIIFVLATISSFTSVQNICINYELVNDAQAVLIDNEYYVALITEPIFSLSERAALCDKIASDIKVKTGKKANVIIDCGLFYDIKYLKSTNLNDVELVDRIKTYFLRRNYEYYRNNRSQKTWITA